MEDEGQHGGSGHNEGAKMSVKKWGFRLVKLSSIKPMPGNPRTISDGVQAALEASLDRFGYVEPIVWNERTGHIVGGHQRYAILLEKGIKEATVVVVDFPEPEEVAANMTLNNPKIEGTWDDTILSLLTNIRDSNEELYRVLRIDKLMAALEKKTKTDDDTPPGIEVGGEPEPDTKCPCCGHRWNVEAKDVIVEQ